MATTLEEFLVRLGVDADEKEAKEFGVALDKAKQAGAGLVKVMSSLVKWGAVAAGAMGLVTKQVADASVAIDRQSRALDISREAYQEYLATFKQFGADENDVSDVFNTLTDRAQDAQSGMQSFIDDFKLIGIEVKDLKGKKPDQLFELFADRISKTTDVTKRNTAAVRILGDDIGNKLLPMMLDGAEGLKKYRLEAKQLGAVMTDEQIDKALKAQKAFSRLKLAMEGVRNTVGTALAPVFARMTDRFVEWLKANQDWIKSRVDKFVDKLSSALSTLEKLLEKVDDRFLRIVGAILGAGGLIFGLMKLKALWVFLVPILKIIAGISAVAAAKFIAIALAVVGLVLVVEDLIAYLTGAPSKIGDFIDGFKDADGLMGSVARTMEKVVEVGKSLWDLMAVALPAAAEVLWAVFGPIFGLIVDGITAVGAAIAKLVGVELDSATSILDRFNNDFKRITASITSSKAAITEFATAARAAMEKVANVIREVTSAIGLLPAMDSLLGAIAPTSVMNRAISFVSGDTNVNQTFTGSADRKTVGQAARGGVNAGNKDRKQMALAQIEGGEI